LSTLIASLEQEYNVQIEGHLLELFGVCEDCRVDEVR